jgi:uncharacterized protein (TIGR03437 family)
VTPAGVAVDSAGNLFIADYWNSRIRRVDALTGIMTTVAGNGQGQTYSGLTGAALQISIGVPTSIAIAPSGDIYWTTTGRVLKMNSTGTLSVVAGDGGGCVYAGDGGPALLAPLCGPYALAFDGSGNLFMTDGSCFCVRRIDVQTGIIQTVAGTGSYGSVSNDGVPATQAVLAPGAIAFAGNTLYILDGHAPSVRAVTPPVPPALPQPPSITSVTDAVEYQTNFSPGDVVALFGNYLAPPAPLPGQIAANGIVTSTLEGDQVSFNGIPGPLLYLSAAQINAVVPYSVKTGNVSVQVTTDGGTSNIAAIRISPTSLSLFSNIVFNPDGTLNGPTNPAPRGATLVMYGTGIGPLSPAVADGTIVFGPPFPVPTTTFSATVSSGGTQYKATIAYLGPLPDFVAGAVQANIQIPDSVPAGASSLTVVPTFNGNGGSWTQTVYMF